MICEKRSFCIGFCVSIYSQDITDADIDRIGSSLNKIQGVQQFLDTF